MRCVSNIFGLVLLFYMGSQAYGAENLASNSESYDDEGETSLLAVNTLMLKRLARKENLLENFSNLRWIPQSPLPAGSNSEPYYVSENDNNDNDSYDDNDYKQRGRNLYEQSLVQPIQLPQVQTNQPRYYSYQQQQPSYSYLPYAYPNYQSYGSGGCNNKRKKKKKTNPVCCCSTTACLETCNPALFLSPLSCVCDLQCCARYAAFNPGCPVP